MACLTAHKILAFNSKGSSVSETDNAWGLLAFELELMILGFLPVADWLKAALVCKHWREVMDKLFSERFGIKNYYVIKGNVLSGQNGDSEKNDWQTLKNKPAWNDGIVFLDFSACYLAQVREMGLLSATSLSVAEMMKSLGTSFSRLWYFRPPSWLLFSQSFSMGDQIKQTHPELKFWYGASLIQRQADKKTLPILPFRLTAIDDWHLYSEKNDLPDVYRFAAVCPPSFTKEGMIPWLDRLPKSIRIIDLTFAPEPVSPLERQQVAARLSEFSLLRGLYLPAGWAMTPEELMPLFTAIGDNQLPSLKVFSFGGSTPTVLQMTQLNRVTSLCYLALSRSTASGYTPQEQEEFETQLRNIADCHDSLKLDPANQLLSEDTVNSLKGKVRFVVLPKILQQE